MKMISAKAKKKRSRAKKNKVSQPEASKPQPVVKTKVPPTVSSKVLNSYMRTICGITDPFCEHARGAKYFDESSIRTLPFTIEQNAVISTGASGEAGFVCLPNVTYSSIVFPNSIVGSVMNFTSMPAAVVPVLSEVSKFRIVSCGYRIKRISPSLTTSGMVYLREFAVENSSAMGAISGNTYGCSLARDIPLIDCSDVPVVVPHTSQVPQHFYSPSAVSPTNFVNAWSAPGFCPTTVLLTGGPANTNVLHVTYIMHLEYQFEDGAALALAATQPSMPNPSVQKIAASITASPAVHKIESTSVLSSKIEELASKALSSIGVVALDTAMGLLF